MKRFTVEPATIGPFESSTLRWIVDQTAGATIAINRDGVASSGSGTVQPKDTKVYTLSASSGGGSLTLKQITLRVDLSGCFELSIQESDVRSTVKDALNDAATEVEGLSLASSTVKVTSNGVEVGATFEKIAIATEAITTTIVVQLEFVIRLKMNSGAVDVGFKSFDLDIDAESETKWYIDVLSAASGIPFGELTNRALDGIAEVIEPSVKSAVKSALKDAVDAQFANAGSSSSLRIHKIWTERNLINIRVCRV